MDDFLLIASLVIGALIVLIIIGIITSKLATKSLYTRLKNKYGTINDTSYEYDEFEAISHYFKNTVNESDYYVDDITWNDLDMDSIYILINSCSSSVGREYLYKLLRTPVNKSDILSERERLINYLDSHEDERTKIMMALKKMGFTRKLSISDYLKNVFSLKPESNIFHYFVNALLIASLLYMILVDAVFGILMLLVSSGIAITTYYKQKSKIETYFICIKQLVAMLDAGKDIAELNINELSEYNELFSKLNKKFAKVSRNSFLLVSSKENNGSLVEIVMEYVRMFSHVDLIKFNSMLKHMSGNYDDVISLFDNLGLIDSMISVGNFRRIIPYYCTPVFTDTANIDISEVYHLCIKNPVPNSIMENGPILITGSNASGKSTFLKSVAILAILAQSINTCPAKKYLAQYYRVYSSMALRDSIESGESYYIVEIKSLKRIMDKANEAGDRILCFVDEVLRGTNTIERIAASSQILKELEAKSVLCFAATHDIELTYILKDYYSNYHFTEQVVDNEIVFSYELMKGRATSRNAIKLLEIIGYNKEIVEKAQNRAKDFANTGVWRQI